MATINTINTTNMTTISTMNIIIARRVVAGSGNNFQRTVIEKQTPACEFARTRGRLAAMYSFAAAADGPTGLGRFCAPFFFKLKNLKVSYASARRKARGGGAGGVGGRAGMVS